MRGQLGAMQCRRGGGGSREQACEGARGQGRERARVWECDGERAGVRGARGRGDNGTMEVRGDGAYVRA